MKTPALFYTIFLSIILHSNGTSQEVPDVSAPRLSLEDEKLIINYDIQNFAKEDLFKVWVVILDSNENKINAYALAGDLGEQVTGGDNKQIVWDYKADELSMDMEIFLEVYAERQFPEIPESKGSVGLKKSMPRGMVVTQSVLFPGLGFTRMDRSKMHLVKGLAGYGFLSSSIVLNRMAIKSYENYRGTFDETKSEEYYNSSRTQDNLSEAFAYTALAIWTTELIWIVFELRVSGRQESLYSRRLNIAPGYNHGLEMPTLCLSYKF